MADALDADDLEEWANLTARHIQCTASAYETFTTRSITAPEEDHQVAERLLQLPAAVQYKVLACISAEIQARELCELAANLHAFLRWLPPSAHAMVVAAFSYPSRSLEATLCPLDPGSTSTCTSSRLLEALEGVPAAPPSILSLSLECDLFDTTDSSAVVQRLMSVLRHHSGLTSLSLGMRYESTSAFVLVAPALRTLTSLRAMHLRGHVDWLRDGDLSASIPDLRMAFKCMPHLAHLSMILEEDFNMLAHVLHAENRIREADIIDVGSPPPPQHCFATMLSGATGLTSLSIRILARHAVCRMQKHAFMCSCAVSLPHLSHLLLALPECTWATGIMHHMIAPLTSLDLEGTMHMRDDSEMRDEHTQFAQRITTFSELRRLRIDSSIWHSWVKSGLMEVLRVAPVMLRGVRVLIIAIDAAWMSTAAAQLGTAFPRLERLTLTISRCGRRVMPDEVWRPLLECLRGPRLQRLDLSWNGCCGCELSPAMSELRPFGCLSALRVRMMESPADFKLLATMTHLQSLQLDGNLRRVCARAALVPCLRALSRLTYLAMVNGGGGVLRALSRACAVGQLRGVWPALRALVLPLDRPDSKWPLALTNCDCNLRAVAGALCALPVLQSLQIVTSEDAPDESGSCDEDGDASAECSCDRIQMNNRMDVPEWLRCTAKNSGVMVSRSSMQFVHDSNVFEPTELE